MPPLYGFLTCMYGLSGIEEAPWNPARQTPYSRPPGPTPNNPDTPYNLTHRHLRAGGRPPRPPQGESPTMTVTVPAIDKNLDAACASVASEIARTDSKASLFSELLGSRGGRWRSFIRTRRVAVSHEIRWSLSGRKWLGPAQCFADTVRHSARRKVRIAGWSSPRVVE